MTAARVAGMIMAANANGSFEMQDVMSAIAWVQAREGPPGTAGQLSSAAAVAPLNAFGIVGWKRQEGKRAANKFQGSGKLPASK